MKLIKKFPITIFGVIVHSLFFLVSENVGYDSGGFLGLAYWVVQLLYLPFILIPKIVISLSPGGDAIFQMVAMIIIGISLCILADVVIKKLRE